LAWRFQSFLHHFADMSGSEVPDIRTAVDGMDSTEQMVRRLIEGSIVAVLQIRTGGGTFSIEARFLKEGSHDGDRGIWTRLAGGDPGLVDRLIASSAPVLAHADDGPRRLTFVSSFIARRKALIGGEQALLAWPAVIKSQERRRAFRERVPTTAEVTASLIGEESTPFRAGIQPVHVWDLSTEGACVICPAKAAERLQKGDMLYMQLRFGGTEHRIATRVCHVEVLATGQLRLGIGFMPMEGPSPIAQKLTKFVEELRSQRVRRSLNRALVKGN
jgi:hypothetical protein